MRATTTKGRKHSQTLGAAYGALRTAQKCERKKNSCGERAKRAPLSLMSTATASATLAAPRLARCRIVSPPRKCRNGGQVVTAVLEDVVTGKRLRANAWTVAHQARLAALEREHVYRIEGQFKPSDIAYHPEGTEEVTVRSSTTFEPVDEADVPPPPPVRCDDPLRVTLARVHDMPEGRRVPLALVVVVDDAEEPVTYATGTTKQLLRVADHTGVCQLALMNHVTDSADAINPTWRGQALVVRNAKISTFQGRNELTVWDDAHVSLLGGDEASVVVREAEANVQRTRAETTATTRVAPEPDVAESPSPLSHTYEAPRSQGSPQPARKPSDEETLRR